MIINPPFSKKLTLLSSYLKEKIGSKYIIIVFFCIVLLSLFYFTESINTILSSIKVNDVYYESDYSLCSGGGKILIKSKSLKRIVIPFRYNDIADIENLKDSVEVSTEHFYAVKIAKNEVDEDSFLEILFTPSLVDCYDKEIYISVSNVPICFIANNEGFLSNKQYGITKLIVFVISAFFILAIFLVILFFLKLNSLSLPYRYLFLSILLGVGLMIVIPPFGIPDEKVHFNTAYELSNKILHTSSLEQDGCIQMRECDTRILPNNDFSREELLQDLSQIYVLSQWTAYYAHAVRNITKSGNQAELVKTQGMYISNMYFYIPNTLGILLARMLKLNQFGLFYLGRFFSLAFYSLLLFSIFKFSKIKSKVFYFIPLLPMFIQQQMAYTYDTFINVCALALCVFIYSFYESNDKRMVIASVPFALLLWFPKGHLYSILWLLYIGILKDVFKIRIKKSIKNYIGLVILLTIICISIFTNLVPIKIRNPKILLVLQNPVVFFIDFLNSCFYQAEKVLEQFLGFAMGIRNIYISSMLSVGLLFLIILTFLKYKPCNSIENKLNVISIIVICLGIALIYFAMYFSMEYNSLGNTILGVQGRYFLPFVGLLTYFSLTEKIKISCLDKIKLNSITVLSILDLLIIIDVFFRICLNPISKWTF